MLNKKLNISDYISILSNSVKEELVQFHIDKHSKVLFIGSGAFPLSALTIAKEAGADVLCLDVDVEAVDLGRKVVEKSGLGSKVQFSSTSVKGLSIVNEMTHVLIASLVSNKLEIVNDLENRINDNASMIIRYGNGLKSIFNCPLQEDLSAEWNETRINRSKSIYDTVILQPKTTRTIEVKQLN
ncbi:nicotianamine synthase family protein [Cohnella sp.]|uniref:nicotianamine synthase family protein n=1 Tax=Cohnella sp. TaxID=1883426 RepID=UPI0035626DDE